MDLILIAKIITFLVAIALTLLPVYGFLMFSFAINAPEENVKTFGLFILIVLFSSIFQAGLFLAVTKFGEKYKFVTAILMLPSILVLLSLVVGIRHSVWSLVLNYSVIAVYVFAYSNIFLLNRREHKI